jgi:cysteine desulfurase
MKKKIYLDYAATTPVDPRVLKVILPYFSKKFANTMSLHSMGLEAREALNESRKKVADLIGAKASEIIFTGSATESNNQVLKGIAFANEKKGRHIIISSIEHSCIMEAAIWLEARGFKVTRLKVNKYGQVNLDELEKSIKKDTILVSVMQANNEVGTLQPIGKIGKICRKKKVYFHTDAAQSFGKVPINVNRMKIDLLTASGHKMYGPKGVGCLFIREGTKIEPLLHGGSHEFGLRSSTVNVAGIVGLAKASEICKKEMKKEAERLIKLRDGLISRVLKNVEGSILNGHPKKRLPNNINFSFSFVEGESLVTQLDLLGIEASTGSACSSKKLLPSHVLTSLGLKPHQIHGSLRLSLGRWTKKEDIDYLLKVLPKVIKKLRKISPFK